MRASMRHMIRVVQRTNPHVIHPLNYTGALLGSAIVREFRASGYRNRRAMQGRHLEGKITHIVVHRYFFVIYDINSG